MAVSAKRGIGPSFTVLHDGCDSHHFSASYFYIPLKEIAEHFYMVHRNYSKIKKLKYWIICRSILFINSEELLS